jgi:hypothetical protein
VGRNYIKLNKIKRERVMDTREDYYKFAHYLFPYMMFNYGKDVISQLTRDKDFFIQNLKKNWEHIRIENNACRSISPNFQVDIKKLDVIHNLIVVTLPEASEAWETPYIGITFDDNYSMKYFTFEIGKKAGNEKCYFLCQWTQDWQHINNGSYDAADVDLFIKEISDILVLDLF